MAPVPQMLARVLVAASWSTALAQLRGLSVNKTETNATDQTLLRSAWGSCQKYGCPSTYIQSQACQCNSRCHNYNNCCSDIASCSAGASRPVGWIGWVPIYKSAGQPGPSNSTP
mmetsp:Transcript_102034/g.141887  ORF Transcript_102034/g.141887 Transcript_102034/m.141887 type:complete len:114 (-) Transcript_102034:112-453(-)